MKKHHINSTRFRLKAGLRALRFWLWLIRVIGVIVPRRLRADWRREWEAELLYRETLLAEWDKLGWRNRLSLLWHSLGAFADALWLQPRRMEEEMFQDLRFGVRMLLKHKGFTAVAALTLALGVGANTAIFSVVNATLLRPLPYREPERIVMLWTDNSSLNFGFHELPLTPPDLLGWRNQAQSFDQIAAFKVAWGDLSEQGEPERVGAVYATANLFPLLGLQPQLGRTFTPEEDRSERNKVAMISHALWQRRYGGDPALVGGTITLNREPLTVVGVMPPGVDFPHGAEVPPAYNLSARTDVWVSFARDPKYWQDDGARELIAIGRLKPGVALAQAQAEMSAIAQRRAEDHPLTHAGWLVHLRPLALQVAGKTRPVLFILLGAVAFVLLIACANIANLLLSRSAARRKEMAVRAAIGAGSGRILRQLLTESVVLSALGGGIGLLLGAWGIRMILAFSPPDIPRLNETTLDGHVLLFTLFISLATGIVFGLAPAWQASKVNLSEALNADGRFGVATGRRRAHGLLVIAEVALAVVLLTGAGLMLQSFLRLLSVDPGFNPQQVVTFEVGLFGAKYGADNRKRQFFREARALLAGLPGVRSAAAANYLPLGEAKAFDTFFIEGAPAVPPGKEPLTEHTGITPGYFATMGVTILRGRDFNDQDTADRPKVCIIDEAIARNFFHGADPLGKRLKLNGTAEGIPWLTIVGVARSVRGHSLEAEPRPIVYLPGEQRIRNVMTFVVRTEASSAAALEQPIRAAMKSLDPAMPLAKYRRMESLVANSVARPRFSAFLLSLFAATALTLTVVGLYGVVAYGVSQRTREIGIRIALGAGGRNILALIIRQGMAPALAGLAIGVAGALALTRLLETQLYEVKPTDPATFIGVGLILPLVALAACWLPARRAAKVDPVEALRRD